LDYLIFKIKNKKEGGEIMKNKKQQIFKERTERIIEFFKDLDLDDFEFIQPGSKIGGLYFCTKCCCVHRPGPCMDLGISIEEFKKMRKKR